jgi:AcrR family transcriptional regulator
LADSTNSTTRKTRSDGRQNRALILSAANRILSEKGSAASLDEIAQAAGVGNGTLYRHFPNRTALVEAVCREDTRELVESASLLTKALDPLEALSSWMAAFVDYISTKQLIAEAASALVSPSSAVTGSSGADVRVALTELFERAVAAKVVKPDIDPLDLMRAVAGVATIGSRDDWEHSAKRLIAVLIAGLRIT